MKKIQKKLSVVLAVMMVLCMFTALPFSASAAETSEETSASNKINVTSNVADPVSYDYNAQTEQVIVTYLLKADHMIVDTQSSLTYDSKVLKLAAVSTTNTKKKVFPVFQNSIVWNPSLTNQVLFNCTSLDLFNFKSNNVYCTFTFDVVGSGDTTVNLNVDVLTGTEAETYEELFEGDKKDIDYVNYGADRVAGATFTAKAVLVQGEEPTTEPTTEEPTTAPTTAEPTEEPTTAPATEPTQPAKNVTINFAAPKGIEAENDWNSVDFYYSKTTKIGDATRLAMTKTENVVAAGVNSDLKTIKSGNLDVYTLTLTNDQVKVVDSAKAVGFAKTDSGVRTGMSTSYSVLKATEDGSYATTSASVADFDGKTFVITNCYNASYENTTYTGYWVDGNGSFATTVSFAAPKGMTSDKTWTGAYLYYNTKVAYDSNVVKIPMEKSDRVIACDGGNTTTLKSGNWSVYSVKLTTEQAEAINKSKAAGFVMDGSSIRTGVRNGYSILNAGSDGYSSTASKIESFDGKIFVINGFYDAKYEGTTYTGFWSEDSSFVPTETATIYFAAPVSGTDSRNWTNGVDFYYSVKADMSKATRIAMVKTDKVLKTSSNIASLKPGEWAVYSVELSAKQLNEAESCLSVGFAKKNSNVRTGMRSAYSIVNATESGKYIASGASISDFDGKIFVIDGCYDVKYETSTYTGHWTSFDNATARTQSVTLSFAVPSTWNGVNLYYNSAATTSGAKTIAMTDTKKTVDVQINGLKTVKSGNWKVYEVTLTADQIEAIDSSVMVGFSNSDNENLRTGAGKTLYTATNAPVDGSSVSYSAPGTSIIDLNGKTFIISGCYDSKYESKTYIGMWK